MEYGFTPNWTFGIEYNHLFMGNRDITMASTGVIAPAGPECRGMTIRLLEAAK